jgi:hypothetical protein
MKPLTWNQGAPPGPIRLESRFRNRESLLVLGGEAPPAFRLSLQLTFEPREEGQAPGAAAIYARHGSPSVRVGFLLDAEAGLIVPVAAKARKDTEMAPVPFRLSPCEPVAVTIVSVGSHHELLARPAPSDGAADRDLVDVEAVGPLPQGRSARLVLDEPVEHPGRLALAGRGCVVVFDRIRLEPLLI